MVSIIGMLSSIVLVSLQAARDKARIAAGIAFEENVRQVYGAYTVGSWDFNENGGTTLYDSSGNGNNGTLVGSPAWVPGVSGTALSFNGTNYVNLPSISARTDLIGGDPGGRFMLCAWVYPTAYNTGSGGYSTIATGLPGWLYYSINPSRQLQLMVSQRTLPVTNYWPTSNGTIPLNKWTHTCFEMTEGVGYKFYVDGKLNKEVSEPLLFVENKGGQAGIARSWSVANPSDEYFIGYIDNVRMYWTR